MREFLKVESKKGATVFEMGLFDNSVKDERFYGFCAEDIVL